MSKFKSIKSLFVVLNLKCSNASSFNKMHNLVIHSCPKIHRLVNQTLQKWCKNNMFWWCKIHRAHVFNALLYIIYWKCFKRWCAFSTIVHAIFKSVTTSLSTICVLVLASHWHLGLIAILTIEEAVPLFPSENYLDWYDELMMVPSLEVWLRQR
jgi:hypothetical protein